MLQWHHLKFIPPAILSACSPPYGLVFYGEVLFAVRPRIVPFEFESPIFAGQAAQVTCLVSQGDLPMDISWSFQASHLSSQNGISTTKIGFKASLLLVDPANWGHSGNYTCSVRNPVGIVNYTATLEIHGIYSYSDLIRSEYPKDLYRFVNAC